MQRDEEKAEKVSKEIKHSLRATFDEIAEDFDRTRHKPWKECIEFAKSIPKGSFVLDLGCGNGRNIMLLAENNRVVGLDMSNRMLLLAKKNIEKKCLNDKCSLLQSDVINLPIKDSSIDVAYYIATLHHIPTEEERLKSLAELRRVLRNGAQALVSVWAFDQPYFQELLNEHLKKKEGFGDVYIEWKRKDGRRFKRFYHLFYREGLKKLAIRAGLSVKEYYKSNNNYYAVVGKD